MTAQAANRIETIRALVRDLVSATPLGRGPIRLEEWNGDGWTPRQRWAYQQLRRWAGLEDTHPLEQPPENVARADDRSDILGPLPCDGTED